MRTKYESKSNKGMIINSRDDQNEKERIEEKKGIR